METKHPAATSGFKRKLTVGALTAAVLAGFCAGAHAQAVVMAGNYQNFDVLNNTGRQACGFEMEVHGVSSSQLTVPNLRTPMRTGAAASAGRSLAASRRQSSGIRNGRGGWAMAPARGRAARA